LNASGKFGAVLICLFALPFAGFGLFALSQGIRLAIDGTGGSQIWPPLIFGVVFSGIGFGLIYLTLWGSKLVQRQKRIQVEHPAEPWLWREDWAHGRADSKTRTSMVAAWLFAIFWNAVSMPIAFLVLPAAAKQKGMAAYLILIFPAIGIFLLVRAIRQTIAYFEFGKTFFEMSSVPGVVGRELKGVIQARFPHSPDHGVHLRLSCVHRVTTYSGKSQSTTETILWRDEADLSSAQLYPCPIGTTIPVSFPIPLDAQPTEKLNSRDEYLWVLEALAEVPGVDYHDVFEVPVFRTQQTPRQAEGEIFARPQAAQSVTRPDIITVQVRQNTAGTEFYFPPARNKSFATSATMFLVVFGAITYFLILHAPIIFALLFGFFSLLLVYITVQLWLGTTRVIIGSVLTLQSGLLGGGKTRQIPLSEIAAISDRIASQQGGSTGTPYYDIELTLRDGKKLTLARSLRDKHEATWLVDEMRRLAAVQAKNATSTLAARA
jgi:hypothetical protein